MRVPLQLKLSLDVDDGLFESEESARRVAAEFGEWLRRFLGAEAWRAFAEEQYPNLVDHDAVAVEDAADSNPDVVEADPYLLKPGAGESVSDLLRNVAAVDPRLAAQLEQIVSEEKHLDDATASLLRYMFSGRSYREGLRDLTDKLKFPENYGYEYVPHATRSTDQNVIVRDARGAGEIVLVLGADQQGLYIGSVVDVLGSSTKVKFLSGGAAAPTALVDGRYVVHVGEIHDVLLTYSVYDDSITQTVTKTKVLDGIVCEIDPTRGVLVAGRLPDRKYFKEWVEPNQVSGFANETDE